MSKARDRQKKRRQHHNMVRRTDRVGKQIVPEGAFEIPKIHIPGGRWLILFPLGIVVLIGAVFGLGLINPPDVEIAPNAIWLGANWSYADRSADELADYSIALRDNQVGYVFLYVSSLNIDGSWSGLPDGRNRFNEVEAPIRQLIQYLHGAAPNIRVFAWIEIAANTPSGYRLDSLQVHNSVANFSNRMISQNGFDGVLLDVKPLFQENEDLLTLVRTVRGSIGLDTPLFVAVPADLTPSDTELNLPSVIAPGTEWSAEFKQRVALQADALVVQAYNSYHTDPVDYIEWVTYQVGTFVDALAQMDTGATIFLSVPNYAERLPAHDVNIESFAAGLDGVRRGVLGLDVATQRPLFTGVAIFTDHDMTEREWGIWADKWLNAN